MVGGYPQNIQKEIGDPSPVHGVLRFNLRNIEQKPSIRCPPSQQTLLCSLQAGGLCASNAVQFLNGPDNSVVPPQCEVRLFAVRMVAKAQAPERQRAESDAQRQRPFTEEKLEPLGPKEAGNYLNYVSWPIWEVILGSLNPQLPPPVGGPRVLDRYAETARYLALKEYCMKVMIIRIGLATTACLFSGTAHAIDTSTEEKACAEIGFKPKTEKFANCVLELYDRRGKAVNRPTASSTNSTAQQSDGSEDDRTCQKYGFHPGANAYAECRMKIDMARQEAARDHQRYERELAAYNQKLAEAKREQERQRNLRQLELGLRMMGGQSVGDAARSVGTGAPITPPRPAIQNQTIILPGSRPIHCSTVGTVTNCM